MSLFDEKGEPVFAETLKLLDLAPPTAKARLAELRSHVSRNRFGWNQAIRDAGLDADAALRAQDKLERSRRAVEEAETVVALLGDPAFRRAIGNLHALWARYRLSRTGARDDRFHEYVAEPGGRAAELRTAWEALRRLIREKASPKKSGLILPG